MRERRYVAPFREAEFEDDYGTNPTHAQPVQAVSNSAL